MCEQHGEGIFSIINHGICDVVAKRDKFGRRMAARDAFIYRDLRQMTDIHYLLRKSIMPGVAQELDS